MPFQTDRQRKRVMGYELSGSRTKSTINPQITRIPSFVPMPMKRINVDGKTIRVEESRNFFSYIIKRPREVRKFRILDIGKPQRHQLLRVQLPSKRWVTQSVRVQKGVMIPPKTTREIIRRAIAYQQ